MVFRKIKKILEEHSGPWSIVYIIYFEDSDTPLYCSVVEKEIRQLEDMFARGNITLELIKEYGELNSEFGFFNGQTCGD